MKLNIEHFFIITISFIGTIFAKESDPLKIYIDADFSNHFESSESIERGLKVALNSNNFTLLNRKVKLVRKDHRGNSARSERHIKQYLKDPNALAMFSGIHSPPLLAHREFINKNNVLFLVPWAAAGPITRYPSPTNSIFRLSIDDTKAGAVIINFAIKQKKFKKPFLLLENTGWGKSNKKTMTSALKKLNIENYKIKTFNWGLKETGAKSIIWEAINENSDVIILVANSIEGQIISKAIASFPKDKTLPLLSHWGIIGGNFHKHVSHEIREKIDLHFIQTSFSFLNPNLTKYQQDVFENTKALIPAIKNKGDILAPTGFIHAHDLGLLLIEAAKNIQKPEDAIVNLRASLRTALENISSPVKGLIKTYNNPFKTFDVNNPDAHEALGSNDFRMAKFNEKNEIILVP